ncbi:hypothetical protein BDR26DRAFT_114793 [Obelidium mucronatum]|nr:hypothetical protein BDR26DRAFT_114793 [Obelidium mucronatum]
MFFVDGSGHPFRAEEFRLFNESLSAAKAGYPSLTLQKLLQFTAEWSTFCATPRRFNGTAGAVLSRLSEESLERNEMWTRITGLPPVPPPGPSRNEWRAKAILAQASFDAVNTSTNHSAPNNGANSDPTLTQPRSKNPRKAIILNINDIRKLSHNNKEICIKWNAHACIGDSNTKCTRAHVCVFCLKEEGTIVDHKAWDAHPHIRRTPQAAAQSGPF